MFKLILVSILGLITAGAAFGQNQTTVKIEFSDEDFLSNDRDCEPSFSDDGKYVVCGELAWDLGFPLLPGPLPKSSAQSALLRFPSDNDFELRKLEYRVGDGASASVANWPRNPKYYYSRDKSFLKYYYDAPAGLIRFALVGLKIPNANLPWKWSAVIGSLDPAAGGIQILSENEVTYNDPTAKEFFAIAKDGAFITKGWFKLAFNGERERFINMANPKEFRESPLWTPMPMVGFDADNVYYDNGMFLTLLQADPKTGDIRTNFSGTAPKVGGVKKMRVGRLIMSDDCRYVLIQSRKSDDKPNIRSFYVVDLKKPTPSVAKLHNPALTVNSVNLEDMAAALERLPKAPTQSPTPASTPAPSQPDPGPAKVKVCNKADVSIRTVLTYPEHKFGNRMSTGWKDLSPGQCTEFLQVYADDIRRFGKIFLGTLNSFNNVLPGADGKACVPHPVGAFYKMEIKVPDFEICEKLEGWYKIDIDYLNVEAGQSLTYNVRPK